MWAVDTIMAFPLFVLAMGIVAALGSSIENIVYATAIVNVPFYARTVRAEINQRREAGFVEAARVSGNGPFRILAYHLFPTTVPQLAVQMTLTMGWAMLNAAALSFIGLGIRPPTPEWGIMVAEGAELHHHRRMVGRAVPRAGARAGRPVPQPSRRRTARYDRRPGAPLTVLTVDQLSACTSPRGAALCGRWIG